MKCIQKKKCIVFMLAALMSVTTLALPPISQFKETTPGLLASFKSDVQLQDHYGKLNWNTGSWQVTNGIAANNDDTALARYNTTLKDQTTVTAMPVNADWLVRIVWKQTNGQQTAGATLFELSAVTGDILKVCYTSVNGSYELIAGNGSGSYVEIADFNAAVNEFHTLTVRYKVSNTRLDFWIDNKLAASDFPGRNGVYSLNFIQIRGGSSNTSRDCFDIIEAAVPISSRGEEWIRQRDFSTMGLCISSNPLDVAEYMGANFNNILVWEHIDGLLLPARQSNKPMFFRYPALNGADSAFQAGIQYYVSRYPNMKAFIVNDEPTLPLMPATGAAIDWIRSNYPDKLIYSNAGGEADYTSHIHNFMTIIRPDVLSYDMYPFFPNDEPVPDHFYGWMWIIRAKAQEFGVPYWTYIQSYERSSPKYAPDGQPYRFPSESDVRMHVFSSLAYGFKGIQYFTYDPFCDNGILDANYNPTSIYGQIASVNAEVINIGKCLKYLTNTHIFFIPGIQTTVCPPCLGVFQNNVVDADKIAGVSVNSASNANQNGLIAFFRDDDNQRYFMIVNMWHNEGASADSRKLDFKVNFDPGISSVLRLNRITGHAEKLVVDSNDGLIVSLPGGTGDLFKYDTGPFVSGDYPSPPSDINKDYNVDWLDLGILSDQWLDCIDPQAPCNFNIE